MLEFSRQTLCDAKEFVVCLAVPVMDSTAAIAVGSEEQAFPTYEEQLFFMIGFI